MTTWYVDSAAAGGGDGSAATPWNALSSISWGSVSPADHIILTGEFREVLQIQASGSAGAPIVIVFSSGASLRPVAELTSWTLVSGEVYKKALTDGALSYLWEDDVSLNPESHYLDTEATIAAALDRGDWTVKNSPATCYIRCSDGADPSTHTILVNDRLNDAYPGAIDTNGQSNVIIYEPRVHGVYWNSATSAPIAISAGTNIAVLGGCLWDSRFGVYIQGGTNVVISGTTIHDTVNSAILVDASVSDLNNLIIEFCRIYNVSHQPRYNSVDLQFNQDGDGIGIGHLGGTIVGLTIRDNYISNCGPVYALDADIPANVADTNGQPPNVDRGACVYLGTSYALDVQDVTVERNIFADGHRHGCFLGNEVLGTVRVVGNVFLRTGNAPEYGDQALMVSGTENAAATFEVYNNTLVDNVQRTSITLAGFDSVDTLGSGNNAFQDNDKSADAAALSWRGDVWRTSFTTPAADVEVSNAHDTRGDLQSAVLYREATVDYTDLSNYQTTLSRGAGSINAAPNLRSDGRPNPGSPCIGAGTKWWSAGYTPRGIDGKRFANPPSIGAYEVRRSASSVPIRTTDLTSDVMKSRTL